MTKPKISIYRVTNGGNLLAYADVTFQVKFGEITIKRFKILQGGKNAWVAFPQVQYYQLFSPRYVGLLRMNKRVEQYLSNQILLAYKKAVSDSEKKKQKTCDG